MAIVVLPRINKFGDDSNFINAYARKKEGERSRAFAKEQADLAHERRMMQSPWLRDEEMTPEQRERARDEGWIRKTDTQGRTWYKHKEEEAEVYSKLLPSGQHRYKKMTPREFRKFQEQYPEEAKDFAPGMIGGSRYREKGVKEKYAEEIWDTLSESEKKRYLGIKDPLTKREEDVMKEVNKHQVGKDEREGAVAGRIALDLDPSLSPQRAANNTEEILRLSKSSDFEGDFFTDMFGWGVGYVSDRDIRQASDVVTKMKGLGASEDMIKTMLNNKGWDPKDVDRILMHGKEKPAAEKPAAEKTVVRTGKTKDGRKVIEYSDGTREIK